MNHSTPGLLVHHQLLDFTQTRWLMSIKSVMPSSHLILCHPLLLLPPIPPSIRVFSNESTLRIRWPKYWSFSFSIISSNEHPGLISFRMDWLDLLAVQGTLKSLLQCHSSKASIFGAQLSSQSICIHISPPSSTSFLLSYHRELCWASSALQQHTLPEKWSISGMLHIYMNILFQLPCGMCYFPSFWDSPHCTALQTALQYFLPCAEAVAAAAKSFIASSVCREWFCQVTVVHVWCITITSPRALRRPKHAAFFTDNGRIPSVPPLGASVS